MTEEKRLDRIEKLVNRWDQRLKSIEDARAHYMRKVGGPQTKYQMEKAKIMRAVSSLCKMLGQRQLIVEQHGSKKPPRHVLMLTQNERIKLRYLLNKDYRSAFRCDPKDKVALRALIDERRAAMANEA